MSADDDNSDAEGDAKKSYNFLGRFILFLFIAGPASVFGIGLYGRTGIQHSLNAAERGDYSQSLYFFLWLAGLIGTAWMIFKE